VFLERIRHFSYRTLTTCGNIWDHFNHSSTRYSFAVKDTSRVHCVSLERSRLHSQCHRIKYMYTHTYIYIYICTYIHIIYLYTLISYLHQCGRQWLRSILSLSLPLGMRHQHHVTRAVKYNSSANLIVNICIYLLSKNKWRVKRRCWF